MQTLRARGSIGPALRTLLQRDGAVDRAVQDALADSIIAYVRTLERPGFADDSRGTVGSIVDALGISGARNIEGTPYAGAGERLLQLAMIVEGSMVAGIVYAISELADQREARELLRTFATTSHPTAYLAITKLGMKEPEGPAMLRVLWDQKAVTEPRALERLHTLAGSWGWLEQPAAPPARRSPY